MIYTWNKNSDLRKKKKKYYQGLAPPPHNISSDLGYYNDFYGQPNKNMSKVRQLSNHTSSEMYSDTGSQSNKQKSNYSTGAYAGEVRYYGHRRVVIDSRASDRSNDSMSKVLHNYYPNYFANKGNPSAQNPLPPPPHVSHGLPKRSSFVSNNSTSSTNYKKLTNQNESPNNSADENRLVNSKTQLPTLMPRNTMVKRQPDATLMNTLPGVPKTNANNNNVNMNSKNNNYTGYVLNASQMGSNAATMEYINMLGNPNAVPKYLKETVRLRPPEKKQPVERANNGVRKTEVGFYSNKAANHQNSHGNFNKSNSNNHTMQRFQEFKNVSLV